MRLDGARPQRTLGYAMQSTVLRTRTTDLSSPFQIGAVEIASRVVLAPMAGVSVQAFRRQGRRFGAGLVCSEMVSACGLSYGNERTLGYLRIARDEHPLAVQVFGSDPATVAEINAVFKKAATSGPLKGLLRYCDEPIVSSDIVTDPHSCIFDSGLTMSMGKMVKVLGWYDNEWGYSNRLVDTALYAGGKLPKRAK